MKTLAELDVLKGVEIPKISFFGEEEFKTRLEKIREKMLERGFDLLLLTRPQSVRYLTGFYTIANLLAAVMPPQFLLVPLKGEIVHVVRFLETALSKVYSNVTLDNVVFYDDNENALDVVSQQVTRMGLEKCVIGMEGSQIAELTLHRLRHREYRRLCSASWQHLDGDQGESIVESIRDLKSEAELECMRRAGKQGIQAAKAGVNAIQAGVTDNEVAAVIAAALLRAGSEPLPHSPTVTSGWRAGIPHTSFERQHIREGDTVLLEFTGVYAGYVAPVMRCISVGHPSPKVKEMSDVLMEGLHAAVATMKPGVTCGEVDKACRNVIEKAGLYENFRKRTGYSVGLDWPGHISLGKDDPMVLKKGMTFHLPLALRDYGKSVVSFSVTVVVTDDGTDVLTEFPKGIVTKE